MKKTFIATMTAALAVSGCVPTQTWVHNSFSQNKANALLTNCQADAARSVPTSIEKQVTGGFFVGYVYIPTTSDVDTNDPLREKVVAQCMTKHGFTTVELPMCESTVPLPDMTKAASVSDKSCFKSIQGGYYAIAEKA